MKFFIDGSREIQWTKKTKMQMAAGIIVSSVVLAVLVFLTMYKVERVEVIGSTRYTEKQIQEYALTNPLTSNTVFAVLFFHEIKAEDIPFLESFELERVDRHFLRIHVNEKKIVGYVIKDEDKLFFDKDGKVLETVAMTTEELDQLEAESKELERLRQEESEAEAAKLAMEAGIPQDETQKLETEGEPEDEQENSLEEPALLQAEDAVEENDNTTRIHVAVSDVPRVIGIYHGEELEDQTIPAEDASVFNTMLGLSRMVAKYEIIPEMVAFDEENHVTLVYQQGHILCQLGADELLEEKITRIAAILPQLKEETGVLHLEDYTTETTNIIFSKESIYTLKEAINQML